MPTYYENEYVQITPAPPGWRVAFKSEFNDDLHFMPIACFALVKRTQKECITGEFVRDDGLEIHPIIGGEYMEIPSDMENFVAVLGPEEEGKE